MGDFFSSLTLIFHLSLPSFYPSYSFSSLLPYLLLVTLQLISIINAEDFDGQSNYIVPVQKKVEYPQCMEDSVCAFLQVNDKGLSKIRYCTCGGSLRCPMIWDPYDGKSITQAISDQYKYCSAAPKLKECSSVENEVAYTSYKKYKEDKLIQTQDIVKCVCPEGHNYLDKKYNFHFEEEFEIITVSYFCLPLPFCNTTQHCKVVTEKPNKYLVQPKCICPGESSCPTSSINDKRNKAVDTTWFNNVAIHQIGCQEKTVNLGWPLFARWWDSQKRARDLGGWSRMGQGGYGRGKREGDLGGEDRDKRGLDLGGNRWRRFSTGWWGPPMGMFSGAWR